MIKFRCTDCNQKLGVPIQHAGKLVKCTTCSKPTRVPQAPSPDEEGLLPLKEDDAPTLATPLHTSLPDKQTCPKCGESNIHDTEFCISCGHRLIMDAPTNIQSAPCQPSSRIMLGLLVAIGFSVGAGVLWAVIVYYVSLSWLGFLAATVCALSGVGFTLVSKTRGVRIGLLVGCIGLCGILVGKVLIAYWVVMPELAQIRGFESLETTELPKEEIEDIMQDDNRMFSVACRHVARQEQWDDTHLLNVSFVYCWGTKYLAVSEKENETFNASIADVEEILAGWTDLQKSAAIQADWAISQAEMKEFGKNIARLMIDMAKESKDPQAKEIAEGIEQSLTEAEKEEHGSAESELQPSHGEIPPQAIELLEVVEGTRSLTETSIALPLALLGSLTLLDLLWFPLGFWMAFKAGAGRT